MVYSCVIHALLKGQCLLLSTAFTTANSQTTNAQILIYYYLKAVENGKIYFDESFVFPQSDWCPCVEAHPYRHGLKARYITFIASYFKSTWL